MARIPGYRFKGPGSISGATRFPEKSWVWNEVHSEQVAEEDIWTEEG
jgi:hypothetical protein